MRSILFTLSFIYLFPAYGEITVRNNLRQVDYRGESVLISPIYFNIEADDIPNASVDHPVFFRISHTTGALNADTRVDLNSPTTPLNKPIYLPLLYSGPGILTAPPNAVSIVRWVAGEPHIWIRIQHPSDQWVTGDPYANLEFSIGYKPSISYEFATDCTFTSCPLQSNLNVSTRNPDAALTAENASLYGASTLLCIDFTQSSLHYVGEKSFFYLEIDSFDYTSEISSGFYQEGNASDVTITEREILNAIGGQWDPKLVVHDQSITRGSIKGLSRKYLIIEKESCGGCLNYSFDLDFNLEFTNQGSSQWGFLSEEIITNDDWILEVDPDSAFSLNEQTVYGRLIAHAIPASSSSGPLEVTLTFSHLASPLSQVEMGYHLSFPDPSGQPNFNRPNTPSFTSEDQAERCPVAIIESSGSLSITLDQAHEQGEDQLIQINQAMIKKPGPDFGNSLVIHDKYAYISDTSGIWQVDFSIPDPSAVLFSLGPVSNLAIYGNWLYSSTGTADITMHSLEDPLSPVFHGSFSANKHASYSQMLIHNNHLFVNEGSGRIQIFSLINPEVPQPVSSILTNGQVLDISARNDLVCVALGESGFESFDISDVQNPRSHTYFLTFDPISTIHMPEKLDPFIYNNDPFKIHGNIRKGIHFFQKGHIAWSPDIITSLNSRLIGMNKQDGLIQVQAFPSSPSRPVERENFLLETPTRAITTKDKRIYITTANSLLIYKLQCYRNSSAHFAGIIQEWQDGEATILKLLENLRSCD